MRIIKLDEKTINKISAGQIIEDPLNVIKELVENSIDAEASNIEIDVPSSAKTEIKIFDDGYGIEKDQLLVAIEKHTTSKLSNGDFFLIKKMGFRGEALAAISSISDFTLNSRTKECDYGWSFNIRGGNLVEDIRPKSMPYGTEIIVRDLFFSTPNRLKFLKSDRFEKSKIEAFVHSIAAFHHNIGFKLKLGGNKILHYPISKSFFDRIRQIKSGIKELDKCLRYGVYNSGNLSIKICAFIPSVDSSTSDGIQISVNGRVIKDKVIIHVVRSVYDEYVVMKNKYPIVFLDMILPYNEIDVNVHPMKTEIRFSDISRIIYSIKIALRNALSLIMNKMTEIDNVKQFSSDKLNEIKEKNNIKFSINSPVQFENDNNIFDLKSDKMVLKNHHDEEIGILDTCDLNSGKNKEVCTQDTPFFVMKEKPSIIEPSKKETLPCDIKREVSVENSENQETLLNMQKNKINLGSALAQVFDTYILSQSEDKFFITDQHAAHERVIYEFQMNIEHKREFVSEKLVIPIEIFLNTVEDCELILSFSNQLKSIGIDIAKNTNKSLYIHEMPYAIRYCDCEVILQDLLEEARLFPSCLSRVMERITCKMANESCKRAIKAGKKLNIKEMNDLLRAIEKTTHGEVCNHGRPTFIMLSKQEMEKMFKRT